MSENNSTTTQATSNETSNQQDSSITNQNPQGETNKEQSQSIQPQKKKYVYKADGKDYEEELDDAEISRRLSLSKAAQKRMQEADKVKNEAQKLMDELNNNPMALFKKLDAKKVRSAAEEFLFEQIQSEMMSPEERQRRQMEQELKSYKDREQAEQEATKAKQLEETAKHYQESFDKTITDALKESGLPKHPKTVAKMAQLLMRNLDLGLELSPQELVQELREEYISDFKDLFGASEADQLLKLLGDDVAKKIRKYDIENLKKNKTSSNQTNIIQPQSNNQPSQKMSRDDWRENLELKVKNMK